MMECLPEYLVKSFNKEEYERVRNKVISSNHNRDLIISTSKKYYSLSIGIERYSKVYKSFKSRLNECFCSINFSILRNCNI